jgi:class 3 adenylate cyclase/tetratricopeptide (TPR) repeat protein
MNSLLQKQSAVMEGVSGKRVRILAQRLAAYIPTTLTRKILQDEELPLGEAETVTAATMFADLSGFTRMAEGLAGDGARGTEALSHTLLMTFTALISAIHDAGGTVSHFHGDAMMIYFPDVDGQAASRALASAQFMQSLMNTNFSSVTAAHSGETNSSYTLSIKIGVGYGRCLQMIVGDEENKEFVLAGTAVDEAVTAQLQAEAGQVFASEAALKAAALPSSSPFRLVQELPPVPNAQNGLYWEAYDQPALLRLLTAVPAFIPPALFERLQDRNSQSISEHRSVTSMFVQFEGIDFATEGAGEQMQAYYRWAWKIVQRYGGTNSRVNRVLTGDKGNQLHIMFGTPIAPDAPEQAVRCALALQQKRPEFITCQRIGLTVGRVFAGAIGSFNRREYTVVGRRVNLSARLTQICPADGILLDAETAERVQPHIVCKSLPSVALKGHQEPVAIFQVVGEQTAVTQAEARFQQWQQPPSGRSKELKQLFERMTQAMQGEGGLLAIHGSYGSGQMPFLAAGVRHWLDAGGQGFVGICQQHTSDVAYAPWVSVWRDFFELTPEMSAADHLAKVTERVQELTPDVAKGVDLWRELLGTPLRTTALLLDLPAVVRQMRLFKLVKKSITAAVAERPLLIILEDVHLADQASLDLIDILAQQSETLPLLLLITYRSGVDFNLHTLTRPMSSQIGLTDFTPQQARRLIHDRLGTDQLPMLVEQRLGLRDRQGRESAVNPLFLEESLQMMLSMNIVELDKSRYASQPVRFDEARLAKMEVPDTIYTLLLSRLDRLPAAERGLLQTASVIGREFDLTTLIAISPGLDRETAASLLDELVQIGLLQQLNSGLVASYLFKHNLTHQVVYQSLTYARRQKIHATIAEWIIRQSGDLLPTLFPVLAYHFSQTNLHQDGLKYALAAAEDAELQHNYRGAAEFYKQATHHFGGLGAEAKWETAVFISIARAKTLLRLGQFTQAGLLATEAMKLCLDHDEMDQTFGIYNLMAEIRLRQARYTDVPMLTSKIVNSLLAYTPPLELANAYLLWGQSLAALANWQLAADKLERAEEIYRATKDTAGLVKVLTILAQVESYQRPDETAVKLIEEALTLLENEPIPELLGEAELALSQVQFRLGKAKLALETAETAVSSLRSVGTNGLAHGLTHRAAVAIYLGQFKAALANLKMASRLFEGMDDVPGQLKLYLLWGVEYNGSLGDWRQARRRLVRVGQLLMAQPKDEGMVVQEGVRLWLGLGRVALNTGRWEQAELLLQKVLTAVASIRLIWWRPAAFYTWGMLLLARAGDYERETAPTHLREQAVAEAHQYFQKGFRAVEAGGNPDELPLILLQLGLTAREMGDERCWHYLETAVQTARPRARYADRLQTFREAGQALLQAPAFHLQQLGHEILASFP